MRTRGIKAGDQVRVDKRGRLFDAIVVSVVPPRTFVIRPLQANISYRQASAREIVKRIPAAKAQQLGLGDDAPAA